MRELTCGAAMSIAVLVAASPARGDDCAIPDIIDTFPANHATGVPTNATLVAHYAVNAEYIDDPNDPVTLTDVTGGAGNEPSPDGGAADGGTGAPADFELSFKARCFEPGDDAGANGALELPPGAFCWSAPEGLLKLKPPRDLTPRHEYEVKWPKLRGLNTATRGRGANVTFTVGDGPDPLSTKNDPHPEAIPQFAGLAGVSWDVDRSRDDCTHQETDRFYFDLVPGRTTDNFPLDLLTLRVFQTAGPNIAPFSEQAAGACAGVAAASDRCPPQVAVAPFPVGGAPTRVELSLDDGTGPVCFAGLVTDSAGNVSTGNGSNTQVCTTTTHPPFFYGCGVAPLRRAPGGAFSSFALLLLLVVRRRHRSAS